MSKAVWSNSWIVTERSTGKAVIELYDPLVVRNINRRLYRVQSAHRYLYDLNAKIRQDNTSQRCV